MCGICGIVGVSGPAPPSEARPRVAEMLSRLAHRGPDASHLHADAQGTLGATRLAIRGIASGTQPLVDRASGVVAVCNGEIDNHRELRAWLASRGHAVEQETDVAVVPGLYLECGDDFVDRLVGAFALAIWDPRRSRLVFARDWAGERPLFFMRRDGTVSFASEVAPLASDPGAEPTLNRDALLHYLRYGCFPSSMSPYREIHRVGPGEIVVITPDGVRRRRYCRFPIATTPKSVPTVDRFDTIFRAAVRAESDVDVPCGVFLSGGIDSSLVAAVARAERPGPMQAYSLRFEEASY